MTEKKPISLDQARSAIDSIDDHILELLEQRAQVVEDVMAAKAASKVPTYDPERERRVLDRLSSKAGRFPREAIRNVYREVMSACLALQQPISVAFLGPEGTFSHSAARTLFGLAARYHEAATIEGVFDAVTREEAGVGVVPIENSTDGSVAHTVDSLLESTLKIRRELVLDVSQCLLSKAAGLTAIERVYSHPQGLGQCRIWLHTNLPKAQLIHTTSTAAAAREASTDPAGAAVGAALSAELYGLSILRESINDRPDNATRFVLIAQEDAPPTGDDKTSVVFSLKDGRGALRAVLGIFDEAGINLTRIESRPSKKKAWDYVFFVDFEGHRTTPTVAAALNDLEQRCPLVRVLGSYPAFKAPARQSLSAQNRSRQTTANERTKRPRRARPRSRLLAKRARIS